MIVPMYKYTFLVYHHEYREFLTKLRELEVVHVDKKDIPLNEELKTKYIEINRFEKAVRFLKQREVEPKSNSAKENPAQIVHKINQKKNELEQLNHRLEEIRKEIENTEPWGEFSLEMIQKLEKENIHLKFFTASEKRFRELAESDLTVELISETGSLVWFILIWKGNEQPDMDADEVSCPKHELSELKKTGRQLENEVKKINTELDKFAAQSIEILEQAKAELTNSLEFETIVLNTTAEAEEKLMVLEGWVPKTKKSKTDQFLEDKSVVYVSRRPEPDEKIPVLLKNNRYGKLFEPIGRMFSLPAYYELDLTIFFAPFFMLFFGFCLGDAGYGLLFIVGAGIYKFKAKQEFKAYLSLVQFLGIATVIFGIVSGTFFGINLIDADFQLTEKIRSFFLDPNQMFNLALILGLVQIIFGLFLKAANQAKRFGFSYAISIFGWLIILLGSIGYILLVRTEAISPNKIILYIILATGGFLILFFSDPKVNVFIRIGKGMWDVYSTVTGIFGDLLSYIRLFALGLSSAILGFVINDIGLQILGSSKILGPVFFIIFLLFGHTLNILIASLGAFVHPMRLTFVEFYKNAGFSGGGTEYKPFSKQV